MKEFMREIIDGIDQRFHEREEKKRLAWMPEVPYRKSEEVERYRLQALNGMLHFWIEPIYKARRMKKVILDTRIPGAVLMAFARNELDLGANAADTLYEYLRENDMIFIVKARRGYDFTKLVKDNLKAINQRAKYRKTMQERKNNERKNKTDTNK